MAALVPYERARVQILKYVGFFAAVAAHSYSAECKSRAAGVLWNLAYFDSVRVGSEEGVIKALVSLLELPQAQRNATGRPSPLVCVFGLSFVFLCARGVMDSCRFDDQKI